MGNKSVIAIPGIGKKFAAVLSLHGLNQASDVFGVFLMMGRNEYIFNSWLTCTIPFMNVLHRRAAFLAFNEHYFRYLN